MKINLLLFALIAAIMIISCNREVVEEKLSKELLTDSIIKRESELKKLEVLLPNNALAFEIIKLYKLFADSFPEEKLAPDYLFKAANVSIGVAQYIQAIGFLERIQKHFFNYEKAPESLFLMGFIYDNYLNQKGRAREIYEEVVKNYPEHKFAHEAKEVMKTLDMTDEELIKMFKEMEQKGASTASGK